MAGAGADFRAAACRSSICVFKKKFSFCKFALSVCAVHAPSNLSKWMARHTWCFC